MADYYIATTGNDTTGDGSSGNPWLTISKAHTSASSGDTIYVADGTYTIASQTFTKNITVSGQSLDASLVIFQGPGSSIRWQASSGTTLVIEYLTFEDVYNTGTQASIFASVGTSTTLTVNNCIFTRCYGTGSGAVAGGGIVGTLSTTTGGAVTINKCLFNDPRSNINSGIMSVYQSTGTNYIMKNCSIFFTNTGTWATCIIAQNSATDGTVTLTNNIFNNSTGGTVNFRQIFGASPTITTSYNCFFNITSSPSGTGDITSDPLFVDPANGDFRLQPSSPCADTGTLI